MNCQTRVSAQLAKRLCVALQNYGGYVVDSGPQGWNPMVLIGDWGTADALEAVGDEIVTLFTDLQVVNNNASNNVGGGGTPRVPLAPPIGN